MPKAALSFDEAVSVYFTQPEACMKKRTGLLLCSGKFPRLKGQRVCVTAG
jgi:hypothetical protein